SWREAGLQPVPVAVNIHPEHLLDPKFVPQLVAASRGMIDVEIVQSSECCDRALLPVLEMLREEGVRVSLEDFSLGYGALGRLAELPIDILKIDRGIVSHLSRTAASAQRARTRRLLSTLVSMARLCRFITIAKGVETSVELEALAELGCTQYQGYLRSPAVSVDHFRQFLAPAAPAVGA
ncbi:diguanylate cyclase/phosphodiesterase, partial [mine drainage metagenome]